MTAIDLSIQLEIRKEVKLAIRNLLRDKSYPLITLIGLALGMISCIYISIWVQDELNYDGFHKNYHNLYRLTSKVTDGWRESSPWALIPKLKGKFPEIDQMARFSKRKYNLSFYFCRYYHFCFYRVSSF